MPNDVYEGMDSDPINMYLNAGKDVVGFDIQNNFCICKPELHGRQ